MAQGKAQGQAQGEARGGDGRSGGGQGGGQSSGQSGGQRGGQGDGEGDGQRGGQRGGEGGAAEGGAAEGRRLFLVPHAAIFPEAEKELPTFNSNAILALIHRLPHLGRWFIYSDDDMVMTNRDLSISDW